MKIELTQHEDYTWSADLVDLSGCPPIGRGNTEADAVINLFSKIYNRKYLSQVADIVGFYDNVLVTRTAKEE